MGSSAADPDTHISINHTCSRYDCLIYVTARSSNRLDRKLFFYMMKLGSNYQMHAVIHEN